MSALFHKVTAENIPRNHKNIWEVTDLNTSFFFFSSLQSSNRSHARAKCFSTLDAYCRLIALLVRHSGDASNSVTKINLLTRVSITAREGGGCCLEWGLTVCPQSTFSTWL